MTLEGGEQPKHDHRSREDAESNGQASNADADGILTVDVEGLGGPEEEDGEEVGARDEGDDERES